MYSHEIADYLISFMDKNEYHYQFDRENGVINTRSDGKNAVISMPIPILIEFKTWGYTLYGLFEKKADKTVRKEVIKYLTIANYKLSIGNFVMNPNDGEVRFKVATDCVESTLSDDVIRGGIDAMLRAYEQYGYQLFRVMFDLEDGETAAKLAKSNS